MKFHFHYLRRLIFFSWIIFFGEDRKFPFIILFSWLYVSSEKVTLVLCIFDNAMACDSVEAFCTRILLYCYITFIDVTTDSIVIFCNSFSTNTTFCLVLHISSIKRNVLLNFKWLYIISSKQINEHMMLLVVPFFVVHTWKFWSHVISLLYN